MLVRIPLENPRYCSDELIPKSMARFGVCSISWGPNDEWFLIPRPRKQLPPRRFAAAAAAGEPLGEGDAPGIPEGRN